MEPAFDLDPVTDQDMIKAERLRALYGQWRRLSADGAISRSLTDPASLGPVAENAWWFDVVDRGRDFRCRYLGPATQRIYGVDITGQSLMVMAKLPFVGRVITLLRSPLRDGLPYRFFSEASIIPERNFYDIEALALPLRGPDGSISAILGATVVQYL